MSKKHPTPWKFDIDDADEPIKDANGERVFATDDGFLGPDDDTIREIADAVNERDKLKAECDRLRDIVRRLADLTDSLIANYEYRYRDDANSMAFVGNVRDFIREARAAIEEDAP